MEHAGGSSSKGALTCKKARPLGYARNFKCNHCIFRLPKKLPQITLDKIL